MLSMIACDDIVALSAPLLAPASLPANQPELSDAALVLNAAADAVSAAWSPNAQSAIVSIELSFGPPPPPPPASAALVVDAAVPELSDLREAVATRVLVS